jgi:hypothetical protein
MSIKENLIEAAKISKNYEDYQKKLRARLGILSGMAQPELIDAVWCKELQRRDLGLIKRLPAWELA